MAILSTSEFKALASISVTTWDTLIGLILTDGQELVERLLGLTFDTATVTEKHNGDDSDALLLKRPPIDSITSVTIAYPGSSSTTTLASTDYAYDSLSGELRRVPVSRGRFVQDDFGDMSYPEFGVAPRWPYGFQNITVVYVGGYGGTVSMPAGLKLLFFRFTSTLFAQYQYGLSESADLSLKSEKLDRYAYERSDATMLGALDPFIKEFRAYGRLHH